MGVTVANIENRIFSWQSIPQSSRIILITSMIVIIFITPNFAEGYYESSWSLVESNSQNNYNAGEAFIPSEDFTGLKKFLLTMMNLKIKIIKIFMYGN